ncbi:L-rhamnose mutarotase [Diaminobutyricibacter tongyongensis]|uniref:L-rhamnose mutarotase n=1 Tax=Leifsonia tongyongensis TaxID=1268043 RepID=A0A6L9XVW2_9MICO|nr:L-rhamnose mutarotase [Diaminobutyricibacter tongyongensis]NEN05395.1 L-rhamnose mutarotase [Diaminobutyricibacter tongyongensis]
MRIALHSVLREGREVEYLQAHATIPDDLAASFDRFGIHDWTIWRSGRNLFHLVECDDFDAAMAALQDDPANQRWQGFINDHVDHFEQLGDGWDGMVLPEVWQLERQRENQR